MTEDGTLPSSLRAERTFCPLSFQRVTNPLGAQARRPVFRGAYAPRRNTLWCTEKFAIARTPSLRAGLAIARGAHASQRRSASTMVTETVASIRAPCRGSVQERHYHRDFAALRRRDRQSPAFLPHACHAWSQPECRREFRPA